MPLYEQTTVSTGTFAHQLPTGTVIFGNDIFPFVHGVTGSVNPLQMQQASFKLLNTFLNGYFVSGTWSQLQGAFQPSGTATGAGLDFGGRITLVSGSPVMTSTVTGSSTVFWTPYNGQALPIYNGSNFVMTDMGGQLSQATTDGTKSPTGTVASKNYDMFAWNDAGTLRCTRGPAWSTDTDRGTGAGTTELERVKGVWLNKVSITNGPAAQRGTYVGTIRTNGAATVDFIFGSSSPGGIAGVIGLWNNFNRVNISMEVHDTTTTWTWSTNSVQAMNPSGTGAGLNNRISYVMGLAEDSILMSMYMRGRTSTTLNSFFIYGIGKDSTSSLSATCTILTLAAVAVEGAPTAFTTAQHLGFHFAQMLQQGDGSNTSSAFGGLNQNGLVLSTRY